MHQTIVDIPPTKRAASAPRGTVKIPATKVHLSMHSFMHMHPCPCTHTLFHAPLHSPRPSQAFDFRTTGLEIEGKDPWGVDAQVPCCHALCAHPAVHAVPHLGCSHAAVPVGERA